MWKQFQPVITRPGYPGSPGRTSRTVDQRGANPELVEGSVCNREPEILGTRIFGLKSHVSSATRGLNEHRVVRAT